MSTMRGVCINITIIILLNLWCLATTAYYGRKRDCVVANFQFQRNFDMTRYPDFVYHKISADPNSYRSGISYIIRLNRETISSRASFRDPKTGQCTSGLFACKNVERGSPAINFTRIDVDETSTNTIYVAATDYKNYLIFYICNEMNYDGTCKSPDLFVESMNPVLRRRDLLLAKSLAKRYCINPADLYDISVQDVCPEARQLRDEDRRRRGLGCKLQF